MSKRPRSPPPSFELLESRPPSSGLEVKACGAAKGDGLFALKVFLPGQYVCEYRGELVLDRAAAAAAESSGSGTYLLSTREVFDGVVGPPLVVCTAVDARRVGSIARFANHSCAPNLTTRFVRVDALSAIPRIHFVAAQRIEVGDEVSLDYGAGAEAESTPSATPCLCGAEACRGWLPRHDGAEATLPPRERRMPRGGRREAFRLHGYLALGCVVGAAALRAMEADAAAAAAAARDCELLARARAPVNEAQRTSPSQFRRFRAALLPSGSEEGLPNALLNALLVELPHAARSMWIGRDDAPLFLHNERVVVVVSSGSGDGGDSSGSSWRRDEDELEMARLASSGSGAGAATTLAPSHRRFVSMWTALGGDDGGGGAESAAGETMALRVVSPLVDGGAFATLHLQRGESVLVRSDVAYAAAQRGGGRRWHVASYSAVPLAVAGGAPIAFAVPCVR